MHSYLRAVGFSSLKTREDLDKILGLVMTRPDFNRTLPHPASGRRLFVEKSLDFSDRMGIKIRGEYDEMGFFHLEHYFPYLVGKAPTTSEQIGIHKRMDTDAFTGMADDIHFGISLIFYLQNSLDYMENRHKTDFHHLPLPLTLSALSLSGKILLPVRKTKEEARLQADEAGWQDRMLLRAREGDEDAINRLTLKDIDKHAMISRRILTEDVYSIVESSFIPYGSESDNYTLIGEIKEVIPHTNNLTGEKLTELLVFCNGLDFYIGINNADLLGEPAVGRRFKGNIWLQGLVDFN